MGDVIRLSIQEIVRDFEELVRHDERLDTYFDFKKAKEKDISNFSKRMEELAVKYIPKSVDRIKAESGDDEYERGLALYKTLYGNFLEIFEKLL